MLDQPRFWIINILACIVYYVVFKIFYIDKKIKKYIEDGHDDNEIEIKKKYLNNEGIVYLIMFISMTIVAHILPYFKIPYPILEPIITISVGELVLVFGKKIIN